MAAVSATASGSATATVATTAARRQVSTSAACTAEGGGSAEAAGGASVQPGSSTAAGRAASTATAGQRARGAPHGVHDQADLLEQSPPPVPTTGAPATDPAWRPRRWRGLTDRPDPGADRLDLLPGGQTRRRGTAA